MMQWFLAVVYKEETMSSFMEQMDSYQSQGNLPWVAQIVFHTP